MKYEVKRVIEEVDMISLKEPEYEKLNAFYREIVSKRFPRLYETGQVYDVQRMIMTDGLSRIEVVITVKDSEPENPIPNNLKPVDIEIPDYGDDNNGDGNDHQETQSYN
jgi:hypothetical protein